MQWSVSLWAVVTATAIAIGGACEKGSAADREAPAEEPPGPVFVHPAAGPVPDAVMAARGVAGDDALLVYVSAEWCEPCRHFQSAVEKGLLDRAFPRLRLLKFDADADEQRLIDAGYDGRLIPRFVRPAADGRASERRFEGSIKGPGAVDNIVPRLRELLSK